MLAASEAKSAPRSFLELLHPTLTANANKHFPVQEEPPLSVSSAHRWVFLHHDPTRPRPAGSGSHLTSPKVSLSFEFGSRF